MIGPLRSKPNGLTSSVTERVLSHFSLNTAVRTNTYGRYAFGIRAGHGPRKESPKSPSERDFGAYLPAWSEEQPAVRKAAAVPVGDSETRFW